MDLRGKNLTKVFKSSTSTVLFDCSDGLLLKICKQ